MSVVVVLNKRKQRNGDMMDPLAYAVAATALVVGFLLGCAFMFWAIVNSADE